VNFWITQNLSGHGCFRSYLHRFGHEASAECPRCGPGVVQDVEHTIFECVNYTSEKSNLEAALGCTVNADNLVAQMLQSEAKWLAISELDMQIPTGEEIKLIEKVQRA
ncbi:hypothetical protein KR044_007362, partial [Drosophila immigrans]